MKANQKFVNEEEAVSPVIAVILMVAITVVLAATVFVLVNDLGKNVGSSGPSLGMVSDSAASSTSKWTIKVSSATQLADLADYRFVLTTPSDGTLVAVPSPTDGEFDTGYQMWTADNPSGRTELTTTTLNGDGEEGFRFTWNDIDDNQKWSVGDNMVVEYTEDADEADAWTETFPSGAYTLELLHTPSGSSAGSLPRTF